jgi:hypothetical protein
MSRIHKAMKTFTIEATFGDQMLRDEKTFAEIRGRTN